MYENTGHKDIQKAVQKENKKSIRERINHKKERQNERDENPCVQQEKYKAGEGRRCERLETMNYG
jgi:hypothetical protein